MFLKAKTHSELALLALVRLLYFVHISMEKNAYILRWPYIKYFDHIFMLFFDHIFVFQPYIVFRAYMVMHIFVVFWPYIAESVKWAYMLKKCAYISTNSLITYMSFTTCTPALVTYFSPSAPLMCMKRCVAATFVPHVVHTFELGAVSRLCDTCWKVIHISRVFYFGTIH